MPSRPADRQAEANSRVEALAQALYGVEKGMIEENHRATVGGGGYLRPAWPMLPEKRRAFLRSFARRLLVQDLVRPGKALPEPQPQPIEGQEELSL